MWQRLRVLSCEHFDWSIIRLREREERQKKQINFQSCFEPSHRLAALTALAGCFQAHPWKVKGPWRDMATRFKGDASGPLTVQAADTCENGMRRLEV